MASSLSNLADNLVEGIHNIKHRDCDCFVEYESVMYDLIKCKCYLSIIKIIQASFMKN